MKIVLTGGGTAGHVTPNLAIRSGLESLGYELHYVGSQNGIEKEIICRENIPYYEISSGKLRRYLSLENIKDVFRVIKGVFDAYFVIKKIKPNVIFSKGGFVSCPVVWAGKLNRVPVVIHESDMTPGLANKLSSPFATKICCAFPDTINLLGKHKNKAVLTGIPVRNSLVNGSALKGLQFTKLSWKKPILLVMGGSLGSASVNDAIRDGLDDLLKTWDIVHLTGKGKLDEKFNNVNGYVQYEYINENMGDLMAMADMIVSRAGATAIFEIISCRKPVIFIPLSENVSRGDQVLNARFIDKEGLGKMLEEGFSTEEFINTVNTVYNDRKDMIARQSKFIDGSSVDKVIKVISEVSKKNK